MSKGEGTVVSQGDLEAVSEALAIAVERAGDLSESFNGLIEGIVEELLTVFPGDKLIDIIRECRKRRGRPLDASSISTEKLGDPTRDPRFDPSPV